ncbi:3-hydroxyacyl-ACP dehydratase FabZ [Anaerotruncus rubiinfantis]|uniref:3-hydroxyacyl-ACP dehydratase FabZ n=1 Tax=Anaerotruncus rubiinfantis TaxID=1720200 RepID=UPI0034A1076D
MPLLNKEQIKQIIPHRDPFLLIDEIEEMEAGKRVVAKKFIAPDSFWFAGHFPEHPVTPGVLTIEMLAQAGAVCVLSMPEHRGKIAFFAKIDKAKFRRPVLPGDTVRLEVEMLKLRSSFGVGRAVATVGGEMAAEAEITFALGN